MSSFQLLSRSPVQVRIAGRPFWVPFHPAAEWMPASQHLPTLVSQLAEPRDRDRLVDLLMSEPQAQHDLRSEGRRILTEATGRKWYQSQKLLNASADPESLGRLVLAGLDPWQRTIGEWCAATYALYVKGADDKKRNRLDFSLALPPPGEEDEWDDEGVDADATMSAVQAMMGQ